LSVASSDDLLKLNLFFLKKCATMKCRLKVAAGDDLLPCPGPLLVRLRAWFFCHSDERSLG